TTFALAYEGSVREGDESPIFIELGVGTLSVDVLFEDLRLSFVWMHQPAPSYLPWQGDPAVFAAALRLAPNDIAADLPVEIGSSGLPFVYIPLRSLDALGRAQPTADLVPLLRPIGPHANAYLFTLEGLYRGQGEARSRMFAPALGIAEDAATGAAAGPLSVYLLHHRPLH